jgi:hypothetical protein
MMDRLLRRPERVAWIPPTYDPSEGHTVITSTLVSACQWQLPAFVSVVPPRKIVGVLVNAVGQYLENAFPLSSAFLQLTFRVLVAIQAEVGGYVAPVSELRRLHCPPLVRLDPASPRPHTARWSEATASLFGMS